MRNEYTDYKLIDCFDRLSLCHLFAISLRFFIIVNIE